MRNEQISKTQIIINNANYKQDFTINITNEKSKDNRYIVSSFNLYTGKNPSLNLELFGNVENICNNLDCWFDSVGGWLNKDTNVYSLDANMHFIDLDFALTFAKQQEQIAIFDKETEKVIYLNNTKK